MDKEPYRELVFNDDPEIKSLASALIVEMTQRIKDNERTLRLLTFEALRGYFVAIAQDNDGAIPVAAMHKVMDDVCEGNQ